MISISYYDEMNRLIWTEDVGGGRTAYSYAEAACDCSTHNLSTSVTNALGAATKYEYDELGQVTKVVDPLGNETKYEYDANRQLAKVTDALGRERSFKYDPENQLIQIEEPNGGEIEFEYTLLGSLAKLTDAKNQATHFKYDNSGRMTEETDAENHGTKYTYNKTNQLISTTHPDESIVRYRYDRAGRLTFRKGNTEEPTEFQCQNGDLIFAKNEDAEIERKYDPLGRVLQETTRISQGPTHQIAYAYSLDHLAQASFAGKTVGYSYNEAGYLNTIQSEGDLVEFAYDPLGRRAQLTINGKLIKKYAYDQNSRLAELNYTFEDKPVFNQRLTYNPVNNIIQSKLDEDLYEYEYDEIDQLTIAKGPKETEKFYYDMAGNHLFDPSKKAKYSKTNALLMIPDGAIYQYDQQGRPLTITDPEKEMDLAWNSRSQLKSAVIARPEGPKQSSKVTYLYDPFGRRIGKVFEDGKRQYYGYDSEDIVAVYEGFILQHTYLHGPGIDEPLLAFAQANKNYYVGDHLGSVREAMNKAGVVAGEFEYKTFGERSATNKMNDLIGNAYGYTGREYDEETGLYYYRNRYFSTNERRFITLDPIKFDAGPNSYAYAINNPIKYDDPTGLAVWICNREVDGFPFVGNHAYLWDDRDGIERDKRACSKRGSSGSGPNSGRNDRGPTDGGNCRLVQGSTGKEEEVMKCCSKFANRGVWWPNVNDCHTAVDICIRRAGLKNPGPPGGRLSTICEGDQCPSNASKNNKVNNLD